MIKKILGLFIVCFFGLINISKSQVYICANQQSTTKESSGEWDMGKNSCRAVFRIEVSNTNAVYMGQISHGAVGGCGTCLGMERYFYHVLWKPQFSGTVYIRVFRQFKKGVLSGCDKDDGGEDLLWEDFYYKEPPSGNFTFGKLLLNGLQTNTISFPRQTGGTINLNWSRNGAYTNGTRYRAYYNGSYQEASAGQNILLPRTTEGTYTALIKIYNDNCGGTEYTWGNITVNVLPSCANDPGVGVPYTNIVDVVGINSTTNPDIVDGGYNDNSAWRSGGGYEVEKSTSIDPRTYQIQFFNVTEFPTHYNISVNGNSNDITYTRNGTTVDFSVNSDIGWYEFKIEPMRPAVDQYCRDYPNLNIFVGGRNKTFESDCGIHLPQYLIDQGVIGGDLIARTFRSTVISSQYILTSPEMIFKDGAELRLEELEPDLSLDQDKNYNFVQSKVFDDYGRVLGESRSYFDDLGNTTQIQVKNLTSGVVLAQQNILDKFGRPAITTLTAPVSAPTSNLNSCGLPAEPWENLVFSYKSNFISAVGGAEYDYTAFDNYGTLTTLENNPLAVNSSIEGTLGWYYSNNNNASSASLLKEPLVGNTSYPYYRILYKDDGTNNVRGGTIPGDQHRAGSGRLANQDLKKVELSDNFWLVRYYGMFISSVMPGSAFNLDQFKANVYKVVNTDIEGKSYIEYFNKEGQSFMTVNPIANEASFTYYDAAGREIYEITPNGVYQYFAMGEYTSMVPFGDIDKTRYTYNHQGQLLRSEDKDGGWAIYMYRKDGQLRFSQDQEQSLTGKFSYINYDKRGRELERGEFIPVIGSGLESNFGYTNASLVGMLEYGSVNHDLSDNSKGTKSDWMKVSYDYADPNGIPDATFTRGRISYSENEAGAKSWFSFDERSRIVMVKKFIPGLGFKVLDYRYDQQGNVKEVAYQRGSTDAYYHYYEYTAGGNLFKVYSGITAPAYDGRGVIQNKTALLEQAEYFYYKHGPLKRVEIREGLQGVDYVYTVQGWLKSINHHDKLKDPGADGNDLFGMSLDYFTGDYQKNNIGSVQGLNNTAYYNGTVRGMNWFSEKPATSTISSAPTSYSYFYDQKYQYTDALWGNVNTTTNTIAYQGNSYKEGGISYDPNGNIKSLGRWSGSSLLVNDFLKAGLTSKFNYNTNSNRLTSITGYNAYTYNTIGEVKEIQSQSSSKNLQLSYNSSGITQEIIMTGDPNISKVRFTFDELGNRIRKEVYNTGSQLIKDEYNVYDNSGNLMSSYSKDITTGVITQDELTLYGASVLGTSYRTSNSYFNIYDLTDLLGSTRVRFSEDGATAKVEGFYDYYPFGQVISDRSVEGNSPGDREFQGAFAEKDEETGWNAFELRMFDPIIGRWLSPDPYGEFPSPYLGMGNNPVSMVDPNGGMTSGGPPRRSGLFGRISDMFSKRWQKGSKGVYLRVLKRPRKLKYKYGQTSSRKTFKHETGFFWNPGDGEGKGQFQGAWGSVSLEKKAKGVYENRIDLELLPSNTIQSTAAASNGTAATTAFYNFKYGLPLSIGLRYPEMRFSHDEYAVVSVQTNFSGASPLFTQTDNALRAAGITVSLNPIAYLDYYYSLTFTIKRKKYLGKVHVKHYINNKRVDVDTFYEVKKNGLFKTRTIRLN